MCVCVSVYIYIYICMYVYVCVCLCRKYSAMVCQSKTYHANVLIIAYRWNPEVFFASGLHG